MEKGRIRFQGAYGDGIGRYGSAQIADLTLRPDGTQGLIRSGRALGELVFHPNAKWDIYADFGGEYGWRTAYQGYNSIAIVKTPAIPATATSYCNSGHNDHYDQNQPVRWIRFAVRQ